LKPLGEAIGRTTLASKSKVMEQLNTSLAKQKRRGATGFPWHTPRLQLK